MEGVTHNEAPAVAEELIYEAESGEINQKEIVKVFRRIVYQVQLSISVFKIE